MDNISFTSKIRLVTHSEYINTIRGIKNTNTLSDNVCATGITNSVVCGLTDGEQVLLSHVNAREADNFSKITKFIKSTMPLDNVHGFLLNSSENSTKLFNKFAAFFRRNKIPYSQFKNGPLMYNDVAYIGSKDEWLISHPIIDNGIKKFKTAKGLAKSMFDNVKICDADEIGW